MKHIHRIEFQKDAIAVHYTDDEQPPWAEEGLTFVHWREQPNATRLAKVGLSVFRLLVEQPQFVAKPDELIERWLVKVFYEDIVEGVK